jgi:hypothetical protein
MSSLPRGDFKNVHRNLRKVALAATLLGAALLLEVLLRSINSAGTFWTFIEAAAAACGGIVAFAGYEEKDRRFLISGLAMLITGVALLYFNIP